MSVLVCDPQESARLIAQRQALGVDRFDEVWEGVYVMAPLANNEHQDLGFRLGVVIKEMVAWPDEGIVFIGVNVSDREEDWQFNYRIPDVAAYLTGNPAKDCGTHWCGGPDWAAEILSPGENLQAKLAFYSKVAVRELFVVDRDSWSLELYKNQEGELVSVGKSDLDTSKSLDSEVLPLSFRLVGGKIRPLIEILHNDGIRRWHV